jgi:hypothetical protein
MAVQCLAGMGVRATAGVACGALAGWAWAVNAVAAPASSMLAAVVRWWFCTADLSGLLVV